MIIYAFWPQRGMNTQLLLPYMTEFHACYFTVISVFSHHVFFFPSCFSVSLLVRAPDVTLLFYVIDIFRHIV